MTSNKLGNKPLKNALNPSFSNISFTRLKVLYPSFF